MIINRRAMMSGIGAVLTSAPAIAVQVPDISERWLGYYDSYTDEIWWRFDILKGHPPGMPGLVMPSPLGRGGAWGIEPQTVASLEMQYCVALSRLRAHIVNAPDLTKLTLRGALRPHVPEDYSKEYLESWAGWAPGCVFEGPPEGWV